MLPKLRDDISELLLAAQAPGARASRRFKAVLLGNSGMTLGSSDCRICALRDAGLCGFGTQELQEP